MTARAARLSICAAAVSSPETRKKLTQDFLWSLALRRARPLADAVPVPQTSETLDKVRGIIAEQLGTDLATVRPLPPLPSGARGMRRDPASRARRQTQVTAESKFVDLGADSLDTVRAPAVGAARERSKRRSSPGLSRTAVAADPPAAMHGNAEKDE